MSLYAAAGRIAELQSLLATLPTGGLMAPANTAPTATTAFSTTLSGALQTTATPTAGLAPVAPFGAGGAGARMVALAQAEVGQAEQPPGSNDSPRIAEYRTATAGSAVAPWCGYFVSWLGNQAGVPIGPAGQGMGAVAAIWDWGQSTGRATPASAGPPAAGDLIVWDHHIGIVEGVLPDGSIQTIEGNSSQQVSRRVHPAGDAKGYVRLG
jgi:CHAP domain-containing protein